MALVTIVPALESSTKPMIEVTAVPLMTCTENPTVGGFAKIATVISADIAVAGQLRPHDHVRFAAVSVAQAHAAAQAAAALVDARNLRS